MGDYATGQMISRDGVVMDDFISYAFEWQVNPEDPSIFRDLRPPQLPWEACRLPTAARPSRLLRSTANNNLWQAAEAACAHLTGKAIDLCIEDVVTIGDVGLAQTW